MKRSLCLVLALLFAFSLEGCGSQTYDKPTLSKKLEEFKTAVQGHQYVTARTILIDVKASLDPQVYTQLNEALTKIDGGPRPDLAKELSCRQRLPFEKLAPADQDQIKALEAKLATYYKAQTKDRDADAANGLLASAVDFTQKNPDFFRSWVVEANLALATGQEIEGRIAGKNLTELGAAQSLDPSVHRLMAGLEKRGWLVDGPKS